MTASIWTTEYAPTGAELACCVQCGLCLPHCPTFRLTGLETAAPRGRLEAMKAVADGVLPLDADFEEAMTFCLNCRACEAVCPSMVPFGRAMEGTRAELTAQRPSTRRRFRHWILGRGLARPGLVRLATAAAALMQRTGLWRFGPTRFTRSASGLRRLQWRPPRSPVVVRSAEPKGVVGLLTGCVMQPWFPAVNQAAVDLLARAGWEVVIPADQTCCGALAAHDGDLDDAKRLALRNAVAFANVEKLVVTAAGCSAHCKGFDQFGADTASLARRVVDLTEMIDTLIREGDLPSFAGDRGQVAIQDPCHLRHAQRITAAPRRILMAAGYEVVEIDPDGMCCGAAGVYSLLRPEASHELGLRKAAQVEAGGVHLVASANPGCEMQLRSHLDHSFRIAHPIELYHEVLVSSGAENLEA